MHHSVTQHFATDCTVFLCFFWILQKKTFTIFLNTFKSLVSIMQKRCVFCYREVTYLNITYLNFRFQKVQTVILNAHVFYSKYNSKQTNKWKALHTDFGITYKIGTLVTSYHKHLLRQQRLHLSANTWKNLPQKLKKQWRSYLLLPETGNLELIMHT
jgi:hypothetical protein